MDCIAVSDTENAAAVLAHDELQRYSSLTHDSIKGWAQSMNPRVTVVVPQQQTVSQKNSTTPVVTYTDRRLAVVPNFGTLRLVGRFAKLPYLRGNEQSLHIHKEMGGGGSEA